MEKSILQMARGAIEERVDYEMTRLLDNILDPNTKATEKRKLTLTLELRPDDNRQTVSIQVTAKSTLAATNPVVTSLWVTEDANGDAGAVEMLPQIPGQIAMDNTETGEASTLKLIKFNRNENNKEEKKYAESCH